MHFLLCNCISWPFSLVSDLHDLLLATSKDHQLDDIDSCSGSFGSRGEALASISDIAVLEIITKAPGKPNGYRKVLKVLTIH